MNGMRSAVAMLCGVFAALVLAAGAALAVPKSAPPEVWSQAERDGDGDIRIVVIQREGMQREGARAERAAERLSRRGQARVKRSFRHIDGDVLKVRPERLAEVLAELEADPDVAAVAPDNRDQRVVAQTVPWGVTKIHADPVSRGTHSGKGVKVAVVDTGIWLSTTTGTIHPDLAAAFRGGYDFVNGDNGPWDDHGHGTHVAGIIAATDNAAGVVGVAPGVSLYALKVFDAMGSGYQSDFIAALDWCIEHGIGIVNYSGGGPCGWTSMQEACERARAAGITIVAAAGNDAGPLLCPAAYSSVISVGSTGKTDGQSWFSNFGEGLDVSAPGEDILSTVPGSPGAYAFMSGTSMATPHVTGAAALLAARSVTHPDIVQEYLQATALDLGAPGHDPDFGHGRVDAEGTLPASLKILAPLSGETFPSGGDALVSWEPVAGAVSYRVLFARSGAARWSEVAASTNGTSAPWHVPVVGAALATGRVQVAAHAVDGSLLAVATRAGFTVRSLRLTAPPSGTSITGGSKIRLEWEVSATPRPVAAIAIETSVDGGKTWGRLAKISKLARAFGWVTPVVGAEQNVRVRVVLLDSAGVAFSSAALTVALLPDAP